MKRDNFVRVRLSEEESQLLLGLLETAEKSCSEETKLAVEAIRVKLIYPDLKDRLMFMMSRYQDLNISQKRLGVLVGCSRETVNRLLSQKISGSKITDLS